MRTVTLAVALVLAVALFCAATASARAPAAPRACHPTVDRGVLPPWARAGFSEKRPRLPHTVGRRGLLAALLWGDPLQQPPSEVHSNKILWVSRVAPRAGHVDSLRLRAQRMRGTRRIGRPVTRVVFGGPGPPIIDLPASGCWRIDASWGPRRDQLDLLYHAN